MVDDELETTLRGWGLFYGERAQGNHRNRGDEAHPIARAMQFAPGRKDRRQAQHRAGYARRTRMAVAAALEHFHIVPAGFVDPVRCKETRSPNYQPEAPVPPQLARVEALVKELEAEDLVRGTCLRARYCVEGTDSDKALWATAEVCKAKRYAGSLSVAQLRNESGFARVWMAAKLGLPMRAPTPLPQAR